MKKLIVIFFLIGTLEQLNAQVVQNAASLYVSSGGTLFVSGATVNAGSIINAGTFRTNGNISNNSTFTNSTGGTLQLSGSGQSLDGSTPIFVGDLVLGNDITLTTLLKVEGTVGFGSGIVTANDPLAPLVFASSADYTGVTNASHVNGYVVREGTGSFTYPVGDGTRYQPILLDLTANDQGMQVRYLSADAGAATFTTTGASAIAIESYNNQEYWDVSPKGIATGKVTLLRDDYKNSSVTNSSNFNVLKVAHKTSAGWQNEGGIFNGTSSSGSITSEILSSWSPFTLGAIPESALPVTLAWFSAIKEESTSLLSWRTTSEVNSEKFDVHRSTDGKNWTVIGSVAAVNSGKALQSYKFTDALPSTGQNLYRLKMIDLDGSFAYSRIQNVVFAELSVMMAYPNPSSGLTTVQLGKNNIGGQASLINAFGRILRKINIDHEAVSVDLGSLAAGVYLLQAPDGKTLKVVKQ